MLKDLRRIRFLECLIESNLRQLENLKRYVYDMKPVYYEGVKVQSSNLSDPTANSAIRVIEKVEKLQDKINGYIDELVDIKTPMIERISRLEDERYRSVLQLRYFEALSWEDVAKRITYSKRQVLYLHKRALEELKKKEK